MRNNFTSYSGGDRCSAYGVTSIIEGNPPAVRYVSKTGYISLIEQFRGVTFIRIRSSVSGICRETRFYAGRRGAAPSDSSGQCASLSARGFALLFARPAVGCCRRLHFRRRHVKRARTQSPRESTAGPACNRQHIVAKGAGGRGSSHHIPGRDGCAAPLCRHDARIFAADYVLVDSDIDGPLA